MKDLIVLVPDANMRLFMEGLLPRIPNTESLSEFIFNIYVHPGRDPGVFQHAAVFLRNFQSDYRAALVLLDHHGCGKEATMSSLDVERQIARQLDASGWGQRQAVVCIEPELEMWVWVKAVILQRVVDWKQSDSLYAWLERSQLKSPEAAKPSNPKEAFEQVLRLSQTPRSSSLYRQIASEASYRQCQDSAFQGLISKLKFLLGPDTKEP